MVFQWANPVMITPENSVHILWLIPQYVVITLGEVMFSITGLEFSFTQAPASMKSVLQSMWLLTVAFGNLIVILIVEGNILNAQVCLWLQLNTVFFSIKHINSCDLLALNCLVILFCLSFCSGKNFSCSRDWWWLTCWSSRVWPSGTST